ncbi:Os07g0415600 [Oryza sativa Japonica Group]|uniref:Os07g0415600 protein n=1 Tax=Oryza sativa subsp. japonica TaxID=39947 RepID=Q0D6Z7_ORYSJ|nr:Os07g0415600 [Oryza sativa Japonica Group]|eukprot:NP_001059462.2 Os07g0415600 [Oryza sativa Japonica Group]
MLLDCPDIQNVTTSLQQIVQKEKTGEFVPRRQHDELTEALRTTEHSGFPQEAQSYKKRDAYKAKMRQEITNQVTQQVTQQFYSLAAQHPQAFPDLVPHGLQSTQILSSVGSVENTTYPVDSITGPTPCSFVVPIGRAGKTKEVASGLAIPGRQFHNSLIPADYVSVQVALVHGDQMSLELDIPTPEGIELLRDAVNQFILWHRRDIILTGQFMSMTPAPSVPNTSAPPAPPSPPICTTPPGSPLPQISPLRGPSPPPQQSYLAPPLDEHVPPPQPDTSKEQPKTCEARKLIPVMVSTYNKEKMAECETRMVLQSFKGRGGPLKPVGPDQYSDAQKSVVGLADKMQSWTSNEVPKEYEYGKPFLPFNLMCELPWPMRLMHEWYLRASELGLGMITVHVPEGAFKDGPNANFAFSFKDLHALFKMDKMDINLVDAQRTGTLIGYVNPTMVCETAHTVRISEDSAVLKNKTPQEKKDYIERMRKRKMAEVGNYLATSFLAHSDKRVIMVPYHFGEHYILFLVYPTDQTVVVLDPADYDKDAYMEFLCLLNLAHGRYKKRGGYVKNPSREKLYIRGHWPLPSIPYSASRFDQKTLINLCVDLCRFIRRDICNHLGEFHDPHSELATDPKFKNLREWERQHAMD